MPVASRTVLRRAALVLTFVAAAGPMLVHARSAASAELPRIAARRTVEQSVHAAYPTLTFGNIACPNGVRRGAGVTFTCTVQLPGTFLVVDAKQTDDKGTVQLSTQQAVMPTQALRDFVAQNTSLPANIDCGPAPLRVARAGQVITCHAALADGSAHDVDITVQDTAGNVTLTAVR